MHISRKLRSASLACVSYASRASTRSGSSTNFESRLRSIALSQAKIASIFESTNNARRQLSFGAIKGFPLVVKRYR